MEYRIFRTKMGWAGVAGQDGAVSFLVLPVQERTEVLDAILEGMKDARVETEQGFHEATDQLCAYFSGNPVEFTCNIDISRATAFERMVWDCARSIPFGELRSYAWIAERIGCPMGARAVGQALGRNPIPVIVPCHRILKADGSLGGFSAGIDWKARLLSLEGIHHNESTTSKK